MIKPLIRLLKYWNRKHNNKSFSSYRIEKTIVNLYQGYDLKRYLLTGVKSLSGLVEYNYQKEKLDKAIYNVQEAINDEEKYPSLALKGIKEVIGEL